MGRFLGAHGTKCEKLFEENHRKGCLKVKRIEYRTGGSGINHNCRPLTCVYDDQEGISFALTPSHLIYGWQITSTPNATHYEVMSTCVSLTRRMKYHQRLLEQFANRWRRVHLLSLREHHLVKRWEASRS